MANIITAELQMVNHTLLPPAASSAE